MSTPGWAGTALLAGLNVRKNLRTSVDGSAMVTRRRGRRTTEDNCQRSGLDTDDEPETEQRPGDKGAADDESLDFGALQLRAVLTELEPSVRSRDVRSDCLVCERTGSRLVVDWPTVRCVDRRARLVEEQGDECK